MPRLLASAFTAVVIGLLACGTSATESLPTLSPTATPAATLESENSLKTAPAIPVMIDQPEVGTTVGKTIPHFEFTLADGTKRSTAQLSSQGQPVFLFFFATW